MGRIIRQAGRWLALALSSIVIVSAFGLQTAGAVNFFGDACDEPGAGSSSVCGPNANDQISGNDGIILRAANLIAIISGIAAVIMIIIGGLMMVTAAGDTNKVATAKKTIVYAAIGLVVISLARLIVGFIVTRVG